MFFFKGFDWPGAPTFTRWRKAGAVIAQITQHSSVKSTIVSEHKEQNELLVALKPRSNIFLSSKGGYVFEKQQHLML